MTGHSSVPVKCRLNSFRAQRVAALLVCMLLAAANARGDDGGHTQTGTAPGAQEAGALFQLIRARVTPDIATPPERPSAVLEKSLDFPLLITFYQAGLPRFRCAAARPSLRESAEDAAGKVLAAFSRVPQAKQMLAEGRLLVDIVTRREPLAILNTVLIAHNLAPGLDGLACTTEQDKVYFAPLTLFRHWGARRGVVEAAYIDQESVKPPRAFLPERLKTVSFVEECPGGKALPLCRGNVLLPMPHADEMLQAMSHAALWLLRTQKSDGSFAEAYHPAGEVTADIADNLADHLRSAEALPALYHLTKDRRFLDAQERALRVAMKVLKEEGRDRLAYLATADDEIAASALLLTNLCRRALLEPNPTATGPMRYLGEFLCIMTSPDGQLYVRLKNARRGEARFISKGEPYAEALIALALLEHISPRRRARAAAERLAKRVSSSDAAAPAPGPRTIEALAEYYKLNFDRAGAKRYGLAVLRLAERLANQQVQTGRAQYPDYAGGFARAGLSPDTLFSAQAASGLAAAYEVARLMQRPVAKFSDPMRRAAQFLMNMQYRSENTFFLPRPEWVLGAFRQSPEDLSIRSAYVAEAARALIAAATVTAETVPPAQIQTPASPRF